MMGDIRKLPAAFYRTPAGAEPVREWLRGIPKEDRHIIGHAIGLAEFGWPVGMPLCRSLGGGLWEIRSHIRNGRIARVIFCVAEEKMVLLHGFIKKARTTPKHELDLARARKKEVQP